MRFTATTPLRRWHRPLGMAVAGVVLSAAPIGAAEFDFPTLIACREVSPAETDHLLPGDRILESVIRLSVRFHKDEATQVDEIHVELDGSMDGMQVYSFAPQTELLSELADSIANTVTQESSRTLDGTLGGALPVGTIVAHVTPSVGAGMQQRTIQTETTRRLPPLKPVVVSGTTNENRGVFFKLKRSPQTTLEGVHELTVQWAVPADWETGTIRVACAALGERKIFWLKTDDTFGVANTLVQLYPVGDADAKEVAQAKSQRMRAVSCCKKTAN